jgi:hypothetical protein
MTNGTDSAPDPTRPDVGWEDPQPADQQHPDSAFPGAGERVDDAEREAALDAMPGGNATVGDMVDTTGVDSRAHEEGVGAQEVAEQVRGADELPEP